jgi:hypothetical protein
MHATNTKGGLLGLLQLGGVIMNQLLINGERFEDVSQDVFKALMNNGVAKLSFRSGIIELDDYGITVSVVKKESIGFSNRLRIEAEIIKTSTMFIELFEFNSMVLCNNGLNSGISIYRDNDSPLRLCNAFGRGYIYHKMTIFNTPQWVRVGKINKVDGDNIFINDEDALLAILTTPDIAKRVLSVYHSI